MNRQTLCVSLFAAVAIALPATAQEVTNLPEGTRQSVSIDVGLQSAFVSRATYARHIGPGLLYARFTLPFAAPDLRDLAFEAGGQTTAVGWGNWKLQVSFAPVLRRTETDLFSATALGVKATLLPGYQGDRWGLMAELGYEKMLATHLNHSRLYRSVAYSGAKDGWYSSTGGTSRGSMDSLRFALRSLLRAPGFTAAGVLVLAIGIGGSTAVFSVLRGVVLRPLGFRSPEQLVRIYERPAGIDARWSFSGPDFLDLAAESSAFESTAGIRPDRQTLTGHGPPAQVRIARVTASLFSTFLRASPAIGRAPAREEDVAGGPRVAALTDGFWRRELGADRAALGRTLTLDGRTYTIVGVMAPDFHFPLPDHGGSRSTSVAPHPPPLSPAVRNERTAGFRSSRLCTARRWTPVPFP